MTTIAQINMIKQQLRTGGVLDESVLALYEKVPRHTFVPGQWASVAYSDLQIPLANGERMMTPLEEGQLLQTLALKGNETVLEIGTGSGFLTALLSQLSKKVVSVEYHATFTEEAKRKLAQQGCDNVTLITDDGSQGWFEEAPYDVIVITGALEVIPKAFYLQLSSKGKMFAIVGKEPVMQAKLYTRPNGQMLQESTKSSVSQHTNAAESHLAQMRKEFWEQKDVFETNLPPLIQKHFEKAFVF